MLRNSIKSAFTNLKRIAGVFMIVLLFVVIGFKMLQFSKTNPVEVLRKE